MGYPARLRSGLAVLALGLAAGGCSIPKEVNPVEIYRQVSGIADAEREPPPGLEQPFPNLASVPARPERPPLAMRESVSAGLEADRARSRSPLEPGVTTVAARPFAAAPGEPPVPAAPPPEPLLAGARPIPWDAPVAPPLPAPRAPAQPGGGPAATPDAPARPAPASAPPDMPLAPPPAPPADLLGPLPSAAPPPPPSPDLMAPAPRR